MGDDDEEEACNTRLGLGLGGGEFIPKYGRPKKKEVCCLDLSFPLHDPKEEIIDPRGYKAEGSSLINFDDGDKCGLANTKCHSNVVVKSSDNHHSKSNNYKNFGRKKLRLTKEQSTLLEESFKLHSNLNPTQKETLAETLNLRPRQVEVWFQNRRARTKLKQTEVDCEFLKKCCESLNDENRRLKQELRSLKFQQLPPPPPPPRPPPLNIELQKAEILAMSCTSSNQTAHKLARDYDH
ncbi:hypothetical protein U1Q18_041174 [Sarracenia purpurea var. burkii]